MSTKKKEMDSRYIVITIMLNLEPPLQSQTPKKP
jgi:hypothetical protein